MEFKNFGTAKAIAVMLLLSVVVIFGLYSITAQQPATLASIQPTPGYASIDVVGYVSPSAIFYSSAVDRDSWENVVLTEDELDWVESAILLTAQVEEGEWQEFKVTLGRKVAS